MSIEIKKMLPTGLRDLGLNESWLQKKIEEDATILGLGNLEVVGREHRQPIGGRIDFLMYNADEELFYEVEVMLGQLDESHIIRAIEYWDIERQRRPKHDHRAVIVAEHITSRFFNILRLLNRSVPLIAIQISAFKLDDSIIIHPVTVLDVIEEVADELAVDNVERTDRAYWEKKRDAASLQIMDEIVKSFHDSGVDPRLTYNRGHVALGTKGYNFCWFRPRKTPGFCHIQFRPGAENREKALKALQVSGVEAWPAGSENVSFSLTKEIFASHKLLVIQVLQDAEKASRL